MKPIHIMRWAPADYVNDPSVKLALAQRDLVSSTFWPLFLFHAFIQGGELPAEPTALGAILGMRPADIRRALAYWTDQGKLKERDGRLYHERVVRDIADERAFREEQRTRADKRWHGDGNGSAVPPHKLATAGRQSPPLPSPLRTPEPMPAPARLTPVPDPPGGPSANPLVAGRRPNLESELLQLVRREAELTDRDGAEVMAEVSNYEGAKTSKLNPATMSDDRLLNSVLDARARVKRIEEENGRKAARAIQQRP